MAIARLRKALEPLGDEAGSRLRTVSGGYMLSLAPGELDADVFAEQVREGRRALDADDPAQASQLLSQALGLWRGSPLAEVAFEDFAQAEIRRLEELRVVALECRIDADLRLGQDAELLGELEGLLVQWPVRERFAAQLMLALYRSDRQAEALEVYQRTRTHLTEVLGLEPGPALQRLQRQVLEHAPALDSAPSPDGRESDPAVAGSPAIQRPPHTAVPVPPTETIGRHKEIQAICQLVVNPAARLVTLTGPGGVGKTRLVLEVAGLVEASFRDGVYWIDLSGLSRAEDVASAIARAAGVLPLAGESAADAVGRHLIGKRALLAIDNFEHVLDATAFIASLIASARQLTILVTSREELNLSFEQLVIVRPLSFAAEGSTVSEIEAADATVMFVAAARRHDSHFSLTAATAPVIGRICAQLAGLPLALELAAARVSALGVDELGARLDEAMSDPGRAPRDAPTRHRTLAATIDWSYQSLDEELRRTFACFSVFAGGATVSAAEFVTGAELTTLESLVSKSLISRRPVLGGGTRLVMLEPVRQYALRLLEYDPGREIIRERHLKHYRSLVERARSRLSTHDQDTALEELDREIDNITAALAWAIDNAPATALQMAGDLGKYWVIRNSPEGLGWLDAALAAAGPAAPPQDRAKALLQRRYHLIRQWRKRELLETPKLALDLYRAAADQAGICEACCACASAAMLEDDVNRARAYAEEACAIARRIGDDALLGRSLMRLAYATDADDRASILQEAGAYLTRVGDDLELAHGYGSVAYLALMEDRIADALSCLDIAVPAAAKLADPLANHLVLTSLGFAKLFTNDLGAAWSAFERQLETCLQHGLRGPASEGLAAMAALLAVSGPPHIAAQVLAAARTAGYPAAGDQWAYNRLDRDFIDPARIAFGIAAWRKAEATGSRLTYQQAIEVALAQPRPEEHQRGSDAKLVSARVTPLRASGSSRRDP